MKYLATALTALAFVAGPARAQKDPPVPDTVTYEKASSTPTRTASTCNSTSPARRAPGRSPAVLFVHGGGFRAGTRDSYNAQIVRFAEKGYVAVTVTLRLAPKYPFPAAVHDTKAAVRWLRANAKTYGIDPDNIGETGASAGGTLAQMLGVTAGVKELEATAATRRSRVR